MREKISEKEMQKALDTLTVYCAQNGGLGLKATVEKNNSIYECNYKIKLLDK